LARKSSTQSSIELPKDLVVDLFETSQKFRQLLETLEVELDQATLRRLKTGEKEYRTGKYKKATTPEEIRRVLS
jgi:hypothetical protein